MQRLQCPKRHMWRSTVSGQGLFYASTQEPDGTVDDYWSEGSMYAVPKSDAVRYGRAAVRGHEMALEAARFLASEQYDSTSPWLLPVSPESREYAAYALECYDNDHPGFLDLYGRWDMIDSPEVGLKLIEYNADTPTSLVESAITQSLWRDDVFPRHGQFNDILGALEERWAHIARKLDADTIFFVSSEDDAYSEDVATNIVLADCARRAGLTTIVTTIESVRHDGQVFRDIKGREMSHVFALYPWEMMIEEDFGKHLCNLSDGGWIEPAWKMFLSDKILSAALHYLYPDDDLIPRAYLDLPKDMPFYAQKARFGREGENISLHTPRGVARVDGEWGEEGYVYQEYVPMPRFRTSTEDVSTLIGVWMVGPDAAGMSLRESRGAITNTDDSFFVPHILM